MNNYLIYIHINKINNKIYVGQTCQKPQYRWNHGQGYKQCPYFYSAIQKYGWDNFEHIVLNQNLSLEEANFLQEYYITIFDSTNPQNGYNIQKGGLNREINEQTRKRISERMKKQWEDKQFVNKMSLRMKELWQNPQYRNKVLEARKNSKWEISQQGKENISKARKKYIFQHGTPTQIKGGHSQKTKEKIRQSKLGQKNPMYGKTTSEKQKQKVKQVMSKKVYCIQTGQIFNSYKEAALWAGLKSGTSISNYLAGNKKSAGKHPETGEKLHWKKVQEN